MITCLVDAFQFMYQKRKQIDGQVFDQKTPRLTEVNYVRNLTILLDCTVAPVRFFTKGPAKTIGSIESIHFIAIIKLFSLKTKETCRFGFVAIEFL
jgi:phosphoribosylanthranilate isomerase